MAEEAKEQPKENPQITQAAIDARAAQVAASTVDTKLQLKELYDRHTEGMSKKDKVNFALWFERAYQKVAEQSAQTGKPVDWESLFTSVRKDYDEFDASDNKEEKPNPEKGSPKGRVTKTDVSTSVDIPDIVEEASAPLADDDTYFDARQRHFDGLRNYKQPGHNKEFFDTLQSMVKVK
jgi:hypothetical protein